MLSSSYKNVNSYIPDNYESFKRQNVFLLSSLFHTTLGVGMYKTDHINYNSNVNKMYRNKEHMSKAYFLDPYPTEMKLCSFPALSLIHHNLQPSLVILSNALSTCCCQFMYRKQRLERPWYYCLF